MAKRTSEQAAETREAILAAARGLFAENGYAGASIAAIVEAAGVTKGALFHHFDSKEEVFLEVWRQLQIEMDAEARVKAVASRSRTDVYAAFLAGCRVYLDWCARPDYQRIVLVDGPAVLGMERWHRLDFELGSDNMTRGTEFLAKQGHFPIELARPAGIMLQSALNGAGFAMSAEHPVITADQAFETFERLLRGLH
ncbi:MAG: TetR family transcriptional regulator [Acidobacteria bacterium]|nr:TetR family transcriptional regulator [Acidobacteriota bacterium]